MDLDKFVTEALAPQKEIFPPIGDFHTANATAFYGLDKVQSAYHNNYKYFKETLRNDAKRLGLALLYGGSHQVVQNTLGNSESEAKQLHQSFFSTLSGFSKHIEQIEKTATKTSYTKNLFGTLLYIPEMQSDDWKIRAAGKRHLQNYPIQSIAANLTQLITVNIHKLIEETETSNLCGDNINETYYNRVFITTDNTNPADLKQTLDNLPDGNILILHKDKQYPRLVALPFSYIEKHSLVDLLELPTESYTDQQKEILSDLQQNILILFHTIHDEIDIVVDSYLHKGICKRLTEIGAVKSVFDKIGIPYINYLFDVEPNSDGSFIPNKKDTVDILYTQSTEQEYIAYNKLKESIPTIETITLNLPDIIELKKEISYSPTGIKLIVNTPKKQYIVPKLVNKQSIKRFIQE